MTTLADRQKYRSLIPSDTTSTGDSLKKHAAEGHLTPPSTPPHTQTYIPGLGEDNSTSATLPPDYQGGISQVGNTTSAPTESHALAASAADEKPQEEKGAAEKVSADAPLSGWTGPGAEGGEDEGITNLGWHEPPEVIPQPLVGGIANDELWTLVRRFNKQIQHVKVTNKHLPGDLDLSVSRDEAFSPDRLRGNVERLYMTVIVGLAAFAKHVARLRSWQDKRRTGLFAVVYALVWSLDLLAPTLLGIVLLLIVYSPSRGYLFPKPAPIAAMDAKSGEVKSEVAAGHDVAMSDNSLTGAQESQPGEAVEQEAHNFVTSFGSIAINTAAGKQHTSAEELGSGEGKKGKSAPDPTSAALRAVDAKDNAEGGETGTKHATKKPVEEKMWEKARPAMQIVGTVADVWEQFGNMLSPTAPFKRNLRYRLAGVISPIFVASLFITPYVLVKAITAAIGFVFFGDPVLQRIIAYLNTHYPRWKEALDLRNTLLKGVPTNAQLTITLLRIGEANHAPLPPPPTGATTNAPPPPPPTADEIQSEKSTPEKQENEEDKKKSKVPGRMLAAFKSTTRAAVQTVLQTDHLKARFFNSEPAKNRLGIVPKPPIDEKPGPKTFSARYRGTKGIAVILEPHNAHFAETHPDGIEAIRRAGPVLRWTKENDEKVGWVIPVEDIIEVEKLGGLGWKGKVVVGWSLDREVIDAVRIVYRVRDTSKDGAERMEEKMLTAVVGREEIVNRLLAMGHQRWICC